MAVTGEEQLAELSVENIGGIENTTAQFQAGVTVLSGRNATNRTSLLQAIMAGLGSTDVSVKGDADEGTVELSIGGETYKRTLRRTKGGVTATGEAFLSDPTAADLFAFLLESNEARQVAMADQNLRDVIMRPIDTDEIQNEIDQLVEQRREVSEKLDDLEDLKRRLPTLETERTELREEIEATKTELAEIEEEIEDRDGDIQQGKAEEQALEEKLEQLSEKRSTLEDIRYELETEQQSLDSLRTEQKEVESEYEELPENATDHLSELDSRIESLRNSKQQLESELTEVQNIIRFNQELLEETDETVFNVFDDDSESVTDELLPDETVTCWTCGSDVESEQIETTVDKLRELSSETVAEINDIEQELDEVTDERRTRKDQQRRREQLERRQSELADEIERTESTIEELSSKRDSLREEIEEIETAVQELENDAYDELMELHRSANQLEYDLGGLESDLERVEENITTIEERLDEEDTLKEKRDELSDEISSLRTRIERIEQEATEKFNEHMDTVLQLLDYDNIARIWLERKETTVREGRQHVTKSVFDLHIIRQTASGTTYEDTIDNLSQSEREVTGLIFALSGYFAHDAYERVPFVLLDSVESIDAERIAALVDYLSDFASYLVVALLPEDAAALPDEYNRITDI